MHREHQERASDWFGFTSIQEWSRRQHALMLEERQIQLKAGRIIPQTNEEYGYEDHYPHWAPAPPGDSAETLRQMAWDIAMAGAYGTAGESCRRGTNIWPDSGGGWINGRGDDTMVMLKGYEHMVDFFTSFEWWKTEAPRRTRQQWRLLARKTRRDLCGVSAEGGRRSNQGRAGEL